MKDALTLAEIADLAGKTKRAVELRATRERWPFAQGPNRQRFFPVAGLPEEIRIAHTIKKAQEQFQRGSAAVEQRVHNPQVAGSTPAPATMSCAPRAQDRGFPILSPKQQQRADARLYLVRACDEFVARASLARHGGTAAFARLWNERSLPAPEWVRAAVPSLHANSIHAWRAKIAREGTAALAGKHGRHRRGTGVIESTPEIRDFVVGLLAAKPHVDAAQVMRGLRARYRDSGLSIPSYRTVQRFIKNWKDANAGIFLAVTDPDAFRSRLGAAGGSASEAIVALNQLWEWDATPADVMCVDGRHAIVGVLDVWTRRGKAVVTPTSRATAITAVLRKAALDWGLAAQIKGDNGQDFTSFHVLRGLADLGIEFIPCPPYSPEKKPHIERFLGTLSHQFLELLPGYVGHNVAERQAIRNRRSFAQRHGGEKPVVEISLTAAELQAKIDAWIENVYGRQVHDALGMSPFEKAASWKGAVRRVAPGPEGERALDVLLAEAPDNRGLRTVGKKGLQVEGGLYIAPELGACVGDQVMVRYDAADLGRVYVFSAADGRFLCEAECAARLGADRETVAARTKAVQKAFVAAGRQALNKLAREVAADQVADEILAAGAAEAKVVAAFPKPTIRHDTPALKEALRAVVARGPKAPRPLTAAEQAVHARVVADLTGTAPPAPPKPTPETRYARAVDVERRLGAGADVAADEREWLEGYRLTSEFKAQKLFHDDFKLPVGGLGAPSQRKAAG